MTKQLWVTLAALILVCPYGILSQMSCTYGVRGSLNVTCINATSSFFRIAPYRFDHLDETLTCVNCTLTSLESGTFDLSGNQIKTLDIRNSSINRIWSKAFIGLIYMEKLYLSNNPIVAIQPGAFSGIRKLKLLDIENAVSNLQPFVFQELHLLEVLDLQNNNLTEILENTFAGLIELKILDLSFNRLTHLNDSFSPLKSLAILKLANNNIEKIYGNEFSGLKSLLLLNLQNNHIQNFTINVDPDNQLRILNLSGNRLTSEGKLGIFKDLNNLEDLDLSWNNFTKMPPKYFQGLYRLRNLNLHDNRIQNLYTGTFSGLPHLRTLNVSNNILDTAEVSGRLLLHSLHSLDLSNNRIEKLDYIKLISRTPRLAYINLANNYLSCNTINDLEVLFNDDFIRFYIGNKPFGKPCDKPPRTSEEILGEISKNVENERSNNAAIIWMYVLVCIIISLVAVLFYIQYFILYRMRQ